MILTLAGPGAGKTTDMINKVISNLKLLDANREMAIITYTNASVDDIKKKLNKEIKLQPNVFVGTIHSFLVRYFVRPYAEYMGYKANPIVIVDKFSDVGVDWIEKWVEKQHASKSKEERKNIVKRMTLKRRNASIIDAAKKGIYTYDSIVKFAKELSNKTKVMKAIGNKIQFLFIDEYQDISQYGHNIILNLEKRKLTKIYVVGDPDQSIYRFRYGNSQIGEKAPKKDRQPIRELMDMDDAQCTKRSLTINHRSSKEIVDFINRYCTLEKQTSEKDNVCKIQFISSNDKNEIISKFDKTCLFYKCREKLIVAKNNETVVEFDNIIYEEQNETSIKVTNAHSIQDCIISSSGLSYNAFMDKYNLSPFEIKKIAVATRKIINMYPEKEVLPVARAIAKKLYNKEIEFKNSFYLGQNDKKQYYNFLTTNDRERRFDEKYKVLTIHKSKGLEADAVLVIAENRKQFFKWLNMKCNDMKNDKDEEYRLGYVAYSRAKMVLALACLEHIDFSELDNNIFHQL